MSRKRASDLEFLEDQAKRLKKTLRELEDRIHAIKHAQKIAKIAKLPEAARSWLEDQETMHIFIKLKQKDGINTHCLYFMLGRVLLDVKATTEEFKQWCQFDNFPSLKKFSDLEGINSDHIELCKKSILTEQDWDNLIEHNPLCAQFVIAYRIIDKFCTAAKNDQMLLDSIE